jgi:hypothetical protein
MENLNFEVPELVDCIEWRKTMKLRFGRRSWGENKSKLGRCGVLRDGSGRQEVCVLMGYKHFEVARAVDNECSRKIPKL